MYFIRVQRPSIISISLTKATSPAQFSSKEMGMNEGGGSNPRKEEESESKLKRNGTITKLHVRMDHTPSRNALTKLMTKPCDSR